MSYPLASTPREARWCRGARRQAGELGGSSPTATTSPLLRSAQLYLSLFSAAAAKYALDRALLLAIAAKESAFNPNAYNPEKNDDPSRGLMQIRASTARGLGFTAPLEQLFTPAVNVELGAKLLRENLNRIARAVPALPAREREDRAIAAYNAGWSTIRPGDAPRTAAGAFINQATYVAPVRLLQTLFRSTSVLWLGLAVAIALAIALVPERKSGMEWAEEG